MTHTLYTREQDIGEQDTRKGCPYISCMGIGMLICRGYPESEYSIFPITFTPRGTTCQITMI